MESHALNEVERWTASIRHDVLAHTTTHPNASDTVEGIARWWLHSAASAPLDLIRATLEAMVVEGLLVRSTGPGGIVRYAAPPLSGRPQP